MTNWEAMKFAIDSGGDLRDSMIFYCIACPYTCKHPEAMCRDTKGLARVRQTCIECKTRWMNREEGT